MLSDLINEKTTPSRLSDLDQKTLIKLYGGDAGRTTVVDALEQALDEFQSRQIPTNDRS
jgi:hypothetical protein